MSAEYHSNVELDIAIRLETSQDVTKIFRVSSDSGTEEWKQGIAFIDKIANDFRLRISSVNLGIEHFIAIDDLAFEDCHQPESGICEPPLIECPNTGK